MRAEPPTAADLAEALERCAAEPIHLPGTVQAYGVLLILGDNDRVLQCGGCTEEFFRLAPVRVVGLALEQLLHQRVVARVQALFAELPNDVHARCSGRALQSPTHSLDLLIHRRGGLKYVEIFPHMEEPEQDEQQADRLDIVNTLARRIDADEPVVVFAQQLTELLRTSTGYDRIMVYQFDDDWHGTVIAESRAADAEAYLGLYFPASDIPPQARALYVVQPVRVLVDAQANATPLYPTLNPSTGEALDLSCAQLRAMSPVHRAYLTNMGVRATLVVSIMRQGKLWGLIACHHRQPKMPTVHTQRLVESMAHLMAARVTTVEARHHAEGMNAAQATLRSLGEMLGEHDEIESALVGEHAGLLELVGATGIAVVRRGVVWRRGVVPADADVQAIVAWLDERQQRLVVTACLGGEDRRFAGLAAVASGLLATRFDESPVGWLLWFRPEVVTEVTWGGEPQHGLVVTDGGPRLSPRQSFTRWTEERRGYARSWSPVDIALVNEAVRPNLAEVLLTANVKRVQHVEANLRLMQAVVENCRDGIIVTEAEPIDYPGPRILYVNQALLDETGYTREEVLGQSPRMFQGPATDRTTLDRIRKRLKQWQPITAELTNYRKDGSAFWVEIAITPLKRPDGWVTHWIAVQRNTTGRRDIEAQLRSERAFLRQVIDTVPGFVCVKDPMGRFVLANQALATAYGTTVEGLLGRTDADFSPTPEECAKFRADEEHVLRSGELRIIDQEAITIADGSRKYLTTTKLPLHTLEEDVHLLAVATDITQRVKAEEQLRASEERLRLSLEGGRLGTYDWDIVNDEIIWSDAHYTMLGYPPQSLGKLHYRLLVDRVHPEDQPAIEAEIRNAMEQRRPYSHEARVIWPDGTVRWIGGYGAYRYDDAGRPIRMFGVIQDITERKAATVALAEREEHLRLILEQMPIGCLTIDPLFRIQSWNRTCVEIFGWTEEEVIGRTPFDLFILPEYTEATQQLVEQMLREGRPVEGEMQNRTRHGKRLWCKWHKAPLIGPDGLMVGVLAMVQDVTRLHEATTAMDRSNRLYQLLADSMQDVVFLLDPACRWQYVSPSCERLLGFAPEAFLENDAIAWCHPDDQAAFRKARLANLAGQWTVSEWRCKHQAGHWLWVESVSNPILDPAGMVTSIVCCIRDISQRKKVEDQLRQSQKLEAVGQLAGGVAHDFNNLLTVVLGCSELLLQTVPTDHWQRPLVEDMLRAGERGAGLTRQLLAFSRQQMLKVQLIDVSPTIQAACKMLARLIGEDVALVTDFDPRTGTVEMDPVQIEQVLMNLIVNARDAMPRGGRITVKTAAIVVLPDEPMRPLNCPPGDYVRLSVSDTGSGMTPEVQARLFEPFFTTKPMGKGTGLGLATVHGIVGQAKGFITLHSEIDRGTTFHVHIPRKEAAPSDKSGVFRRLPVRGGEVILIVEDEPSVRTLTATILNQHGYQVWTAESGSAALAMCAQRESPPALLLTDVVMPEMSGRDLVQQMVARYPRLKVVFLSGYTSDAILRHGVEQERVAFMQKPYTPDKLARYVREVLDQE